MWKVCNGCLWNRWTQWCLYRCCTKSSSQSSPKSCTNTTNNKYWSFNWTLLLILFLDCGKTNKQTILKKLKVVKKVKTSLDCQKLCANFSGCTHFVWKNNKKVAKRTCTLQTIGYKTKKNFVSGPVSCWTDKLLIYFINQVTSVYKQNSFSWSH